MAGLIRGRVLLVGAWRARYGEGGLLFALLVQIGKEQRMRVRLFDEEGALVADSFALDEEPAFTFDNIEDDTWDQQFARWLDKAVDAIVSAEPVQDYVEPEAQQADPTRPHLRSHPRIRRGGHR